MNDWPADPRLDAELRGVVDAELAAARADAVGLSRRAVARRHSSGRALAGLGTLAVVAIAAALVLRGAGTGRSTAGGADASPPMASSSPIATPQVSAGAPAPSSAEPTPAASAKPGTFLPTGAMTTSDNGTATLLLDGRVLIVGNAATSPELYDPATGRFTVTGPAAIDGNFGTATRLLDGRVLFVGGNNQTTSFATAQIYDPATGEFSPTGSMKTSRMGHTATLLADGRVLIAGGSTFNHAATTMIRTVAYHPGAGGARTVPPAMTGPDMLASAELYDPKTGKFSSAGSMTTGRSYAGSTLLADGRVLIAGGGNEGSAAAATAELYNPTTGKFSRTGSMLVRMYYFNTTLLPDGRVLISAGNDGNGPVYSLETYDPKTGKFSSAGSVGESRGFYTVALLANGSVLIIGGYDTAAAKGAGFLATCELYDPATGKLSPTGSMATGREANSVTTLLDGRVLVAGGAGAGDPPPLPSAELYQP